ncbi:hypothetical protein [Hydrogenophaga sp.]|uniref:hypothetical protein n=1 Tax=Hydrogenophaga sp. TaxID=1904254 RepID=UPI002628B358|nr:hypothetical protein [Hydrogenophaga sp.]
MTGQDLRRRRGKADATVRLEQAIIEIVDERHPITVRGVCYALFTKGMLPDMSVNSTGKISRVMTDMRECDMLEWTHVVDGSRAVDRSNSWSDPSAIIAAAVRGYRRDNWQDQPRLVEVWSEKSTVQGVLQPVLDDLGVTFRVMKGFGSFTAVRQAAEDSLELPAHVDGVVLYVGDWDASGLYMSAMDLPARLTRYGSQWQFRRIALIRDDLDGLPHFPTSTKSGDVRLEWYLQNTTADPKKCWELDAMDPNALRQRVQSEIQALMDMDAWRHALVVERAQRDSMDRFHQAWNSHLQSGAR